MLLQNGSFWAIARCKGIKACYVAAHGFREQRKLYYIPKTFEGVKHGRTVIPKPVMRFAPYLFVECRHEAKWVSEILHTRGIEDLLRQSERKAWQVPTEIVNGFIGAEDIELEAMEFRVRRKVSSYTPGTKVKIDSHPLWEGRIGRLLSDCDGKAHVLMNEFIYITVPTRDISPMESGEDEADNQ